MMVDIVSQVRPVVQLKNIIQRLFGIGNVEEKMFPIYLHAYFQSLLTRRI
jgi:hypothetical protein